MIFSVWNGSVNLGVETVKFRYFVGYYLQSDLSKPATLIISKWESKTNFNKILVKLLFLLAHLTPRSVMPAVEASKNGVCRSNLNDVFGFSGGRETVSSGWVLREDQNQIILMISGQILKFFNKHKAEREYNLKIVPFDLRTRSVRLFPCDCKQVIYRTVIMMMKMNNKTRMIFYLASLAILTRT